MSRLPFLPEHGAMARKLLADTKANGGLAPLDLARFWTDDAAAWRDPFGRDIPQVPFGASLNSLCVYDELGVPEDVWRYDLDRRYNDRAETIVGRRLLAEDPPGEREPGWPEPGGLHDVFEAKNEWHSHAWWLMPAASTPAELSALLDRVERRDVRATILPPEWAEARARLLPRGVKPPRYRMQRGPVTFAMSVYGVENLIELIADDPLLAARFRDAILRVMLAIARILDEEAGYTPATAPRGFQFNDDQSAMLNPAMYEFFSVPILEGVFDRFAPTPYDRRAQHSDSAMGHLLPALGRLGLTYANFGPTLTVQEIRAHLPRAVIHGQLAPYTYSRNDEEGIVLEFLRDFTQARERRGLVFETAGSINEGTRLTSMRLAMSAVQRFGRYAP